MDVFDTLFFSVVGVGNDANGQRIVDVEVVPTGLYLVEIPHVPDSRVAHVGIFGRLVLRSRSSTGLLLSAVEDVADTRLQRELHVFAFEAQDAFESKSVEGLTGIKAAFLAQQAHGVAITLTGQVGVGVDEVVIVRLHKEFTDFFFHRVGVAIFVTEEFGRPLIEFCAFHSLEKAHIAFGRADGLQSLGATTGFDGAPCHVGIVSHGVIAHNKTSGRIDVARAVFGGRQGLSALFAEGVAIDEMRGCIEGARKSHLQTFGHDGGFTSSDNGILVEGAVTDAKEMLVHLERTTDFVGHLIALFVGFIEIAGELVVDEQSVLVVVAQFQAIEHFVGSHHIEVVTGCGNRHFAIIVFGNVDFLHHWEGKTVACLVDGAIYIDFVFAIRTNIEGATGITHAQDGVNGIDLVVALDIAFDG